MKFSFAILFFSSYFPSSFACKIAVDRQDIAAPCSPMYSYNPIYAPLNGVTIAYYSMVPSETEIALTAKIDSQEVRMNLIFDTLDSAKIVLSKQESEIKKLERINEENKAKIRKQKQQRDKGSCKSMWTISLLGISTAIGAVFSLRYIVARKHKVKR